MKYMGSKNKYACAILAKIKPYLNDTTIYIEPFVGGANVIDKLQHPYKMGADSNKYLVALLQALQDGWEPPKKVPEELYHNVKKNPEAYDAHLVGYIGFNLSFGAKWFGGYRRDSIGSRDYSLESYRNVMAQAKNLNNIQFKYSNYLELDIPDNSIVYCDPPYANTTGYKDSFNSSLFWDWCRKLNARGIKVFISEYKAPEDFVAIWEHKVHNSLDLNTGSKTGVEKLFIHRSFYESGSFNRS